MSDRRCLSFLLLLLCSCQGDSPRRSAPLANFLLVAGDSTFWIREDAGELLVRGSPIQLARVDGSFYELYSTDDDRSYYDAILVGQRIYRRDLLSGDSAIVFDDTTVASLARWYGREHPARRPLEPDEEPSEDPHIDVAGEVEILDQLGPYLSWEYHVDGNMIGTGEWHTVRRGVVDIRTGAAATLPELLGDSVAARIWKVGANLWADAVDSVLASRDVRAPAAARAIGDFSYDSTSFSLLLDGRSPAVEFAASGRGPRAGGTVLTMDPIRVPEPSWWSEVLLTLPLASADTSVEKWHSGRNRVEVRYDTLGGPARLVVIDSVDGEWPIARVPTPGRRIYWLTEAGDSTLHALDRAFDEAAGYSGETRSASAGGAKPRLAHDRVRERIGRSAFPFVVARTSFK
ncbi:MAG: hypothetical protein H7Z74_02710 [Anaerolineae bacterium]|nr:hypothetical protein [Gemmatimonadaceae bacterium]